MYVPLNSYTSDHTFIHLYIYIFTCLNKVVLVKKTELIICPLDWYKKTKGMKITYKKLHDVHNHITVQYLFPALPLCFLCTLI